MKVSQVLLVREDDGLVLSDNLAPEALPARGQLPQLLQFTHSASKTHPSGHGARSPPWRGTERTDPENKVYTEVWSMPGEAQAWPAGCTTDPPEGRAACKEDHRPYGKCTGKLFIETQSNVWGKLSGRAERRAAPPWPQHAGWYRKPHRRRLRCSPSGSGRKKTTCVPPRTRGAGGHEPLP